MNLCITDRPSFTCTTDWIWLGVMSASRRTIAWLWAPEEGVVHGTAQLIPHRAQSRIAARQGREELLKWTLAIIFLWVYSESWVGFQDDQDGEVWLLSVDLKWSIGFQTVSVRLSFLICFLSISWLKSPILIIFIVTPILLLKKILSYRLTVHGTWLIIPLIFPTSRASFDKICRHSIMWLTICFAY